MIGPSTQFHTCKATRVIRIFLISCAYIVLAAYQNPCTAEQPLETVIIAVGEWPPFLSKNMSDYGTVGSKIQKAFKAANIQTQFIFMPWKRSYMEAKNGKAQATGIWLKNKNREESFYYSVPVMKETHVFFHLKSTQIKNTTIKNLCKYKFGGILGFSYGEALTKAEEEGELLMERISDDVHNFKKLLQGRIDIYPQEISVGFYILNKYFDKIDINRITYYPTPFMTRQSYLLFPKKNKQSAELLNIFNDAFQALNE